MKNKTIKYLLIIILINLLTVSPANALAPHMAANNITESFKSTYAAIEWFKSIKDELGFTFSRISDLDIENSTKLVLHAIDQSDNKIERIIVVGNGLLFMPILFALLGKEVIFIDASEEYFLYRFRPELENLRKKINPNFKFSFKIINDEIGEIDYQAYNLKPNSFDLITYIDLSGGIGPVGNPYKWMETAKTLLKNEAYLMIDHEYSERTIPPLKKIFPKNSQLPVFVRERSNNMIFDAPISIRGTYGGQNFLHRVKNSDIETAI